MHFRVLLKTFYMKKFQKLNFSFVSETPKIFCLILNVFNLAEKDFFFNALSHKKNCTKANFFIIHHFVHSLRLYLTFYSTLLHISFFIHFSLHFSSFYYIFLLYTAIIIVSKSGNIFL